MKALLEIRNALKAKKPTFIRHDAHKKKRADGGAWRRPKGITNKVRLHRKGYAKGRSTGYGSPVAVKGLSREGLKQVVVKNAADFDGLNPKEDGIIFSRTVGARKKLELIKIATEKKFKVLALDTKKFEERVKANLTQKSDRKKALVQKQQEKSAQAKKAQEKTKASAKQEEEVSAEAKKEQEKKEHDKVLTKKDGDY